MKKLISIVVSAVLLLGVFNIGLVHGATSVINMDFTGMKGGDVSANWEVEAGNTSGAWKYLNSTVDGNKTNVVLKYNTPNGTGHYARYKGADNSTYAVQATLACTSYNTNDKYVPMAFTGFILNADATCQGGYRFVYSNATSSFKITKLTPSGKTSAETVLGEKAASDTKIGSFQLGTIYTFKMVTGSALKFYVNGELIVSASDPNPTTGGSVACVATYAQTEYDNIVAYAGSDAESADFGAAAPAPAASAKPTASAKPSATPGTTAKPVPVPIDNGNTTPDDSEIKVLLNGQKLTFDQPPVIQNNRTLVPLRVIFEALGAVVDWNGDTQTVTATKDDKTIVLVIGDPAATVNGETVELDQPAIIMNGRTLVPVRFVSEALDAQVDWDGGTQTVTITTSDTAAASVADPQDFAWMFFQGIGWAGSPAENLKYAKALGYKYVFHMHQDLLKANYTSDYERPELNQYKQDLNFYVNDPFKTIQPRVPDGTIQEPLLSKIKAEYPDEFNWYPEIPRFFYINHWAQIKTEHPDIYAVYKNMYEQHFAWYDASLPFPDNLMKRTFNANSQCAIFLNEFQNQREIDFWVNTIVDHIKNYSEIPEINYRFAGYFIDVVEIDNEIKYSGKTIRDDHSGIPHSGLSLDYSDYYIGQDHFLLELLQKSREAFPGRAIHTMWEPGTRLNGTIYDSWVAYVVNDPTLSESEKAAVVGDLMMGEDPDLQYLTDNRIYNTGWFHLDTVGANVGTTGPNINGYYSDDNEQNCLNSLGRVASRGGWFEWYGIHNRGTGSFASGLTAPVELYQFPSEWKLARLVSGWDNMNNVPISQRSWDETNKIYKSTTSYADRNIIYSRRYDNGNIYVTFVNDGGTLKLNPGETVKSISRVDDYWLPTVDGSADLTVSGTDIKINAVSGYKNKSYIITLN